jgi:two-component system response regulator AtoC
MIRATAALDSTILISGESGTGKELVACAIHQMSPRHKNPFVKVNCAALPETLLESELFGHERGAFTGAVRERKGKFEQAHLGTIFLDEIGEMPLAAQAKLLRVIQGKTLERIGGNREIVVDVRIIAATNKDLRREVERGAFREDLFYRLNVIPIHLPPLRERREDILSLAEHFLSVYAERMRKPVRCIAPDARKALLDYDYPGNVRELENAIERGVALSMGETITLADLAPYFVTGASAAPAGAALPKDPPAATLSRAVSVAEQEAIREALQTTGNRKGVAAKLLGISRKTLWEKLKQMERT